MVKPDLKKATAIANFPEPGSKGAVQQFLGMAGFYRKFIKDFTIQATLRPDLNREFIIQTYALGVGRAAVLCKNMTTICFPSILQVED